MMHPPTLDDLYRSPLLAHGVIDCQPSGDPVACMECWDCQFFDMEEAGAGCAMEAAVTMGNATPELARLFGWTPNDDQPSLWSAPDRCPWFRDKSLPPLPHDDPRQIDAFATEDAT